MDRSDMKAEGLTPLQILQQAQRLMVPLFQRPYVWGREAQWEPLWDDITRMADSLRPDVVAPPKPHFLGAVVLQQRLVSIQSLPQRWVIDGQQRLTTLQIVIDAVQACMEEMELSSPAVRLRDLIENKEQYRREENDAFKLWPTNRDRDAYREVMSAAPPVNYSQLNNRNERIVQAHKYFSEAAREYLQVEDAMLQARRADALETAITQLLKLVVIDLDADEDAQEIFETLNSRGVKLSSADLIKNLIFQRLEDESANTEQAYEKFWKRFETAFWETEIVAGRLKQPRTAVFLNHFLIARTGEVVTASEVFYRFKEYLADSGKTTLQLLKEIHDVAVVYEKHVANAENDNSDLDAIDLFVYRTQVMDVEVVKSVLIYLLDPAHEAIDNDTVIEALTHLESWLVRRALMRAVTKGSNRFIAQLVSVLREGARPDAANILKAFLSSQTADSSYWPDDRQIEEQLTDFRLYRLMPRGRTRMILEALEDELRGITRTTSGDAEQRCPRRTLSVEHLVPQKWSPHWPLTPGESDESRNRVVQTLGNLTLLTKKLNSKVSNGPWTGEDGKRAALQGHSSLLLNARLEVDFGEAWDAQRIHVRTTALTQLVTNIWPVPAGHAVFPIGDNQPLGAYVSVEDLISAGMIDDGTVLRSASAAFAHRSAMIRNDGSIEVDSGEVFTSLSGAARHVRNSQTAPGWNFWRIEASGRLMYDVREEYRARFDLTLAEDEEEIDALEADEALV
jgi:uncharacterized protein with ParB-like and HNH nuclease domain